MKLTGPWNDSQVGDFLEGTVVPLRLSVVSRRGWPVVVSLWFVYENGALWCATQRSARVVKHLEANHRCGFEVSTNDPPYKGIRGRGRATVEARPGKRILRALLKRYQGGEDSPLARWLLGRAENEVAIRIEPKRFTSWDFSNRMTG